MGIQSRTTKARSIWLWPGSIAAAIAVLDQAAKAWVWGALGPAEGTSVPLAGEWLRLTLVKNTGVAFGMFQHIPYLFTVTPMLISLGTLYFYRYHLPHSKLLIQLCTGMIVGGALGNIIDRLRLGFVIDFIHVTWFPGIFNVADSAITVGVLLLAGYLLLFGDQPPPQPVGDDRLLGELLNRDTLSQRDT